MSCWARKWNIVSTSHGSLRASVGAFRPRLWYTARFLLSYPATSICLWDAHTNLLCPRLRWTPRVQRRTSPGTCPLQPAWSPWVFCMPFATRGKRSRRPRCRASPSEPLPSPSELLQIRRALPYPPTAQIYGTVGFGLALPPLRTVGVCRWKWPLFLRLCPRVRSSWADWLQVESALRVGRRQAWLLVCQNSCALWGLAVFDYERICREVGLWRTQCCGRNPHAAVSKQWHFGQACGVVVAWWCSQNVSYPGAGYRWMYEMCIPWGRRRTCWRGQACCHPQTAKGRFRCCLSPACPCHMPQLLYNSPSLLFVHHF